MRDRLFDVMIRSLCLVALLGGVQLGGPTAIRVVILLVNFLVEIMWPISADLVAIFAVYLPVVALIEIFEFQLVFGPVLPKLGCLYQDSLRFHLLFQRHMDLRCGLVT